jgi:hypothetical protein
MKAVTKNLKILNLENNSLGQRGALEVVETFASKSSDFRLLLNGNPFDSGSLALSLASAKHLAETEVIELRKERDRLRAGKADAQSNLRDLLAEQSTMHDDMHEIQARAKQLEDDKDGLVKAFSVLGMMQHTRERDLILKRLSKLEEAVLCESDHSKTPQRGRSRTSSEADDLPRPTCLSRTQSAESKRPLPRPEQKVGRVPSMSRRSGRPATARGLLVKAASERWKNLLSKPSPKRQDFTRASSSKSLAEFLNTSEVSDKEVTDDVSLDNGSIQTTPAGFGDLRGRLRRDDSSSCVGSEGHGSFRSLPAFDMSSHSVKPVCRVGNGTAGMLDSLPSDIATRPP